MSLDDAGGAYRPLMRFDRDDYAAHLVRLPKGDRRARFQRMMTDDHLRGHAERAFDKGLHVIGWFDDGVMRGAAEVGLSPDGASAESAFEVEPEWRGRGVGRRLVSMVHLWARNRGARELVIYTERANVAMLRCAKQEGAQFTFDLTDAEGVIAAEKATPFSYWREWVEDEQGWAGWAVQRMRRQARRMRAMAWGGFTG